MFCVRGGVRAGWAPRACRHAWSWIRRAPRRKYKEACERPRLAPARDWKERRGNLRANTATASADAKVVVVVVVVTFHSGVENTFVTFWRVLVSATPERGTAEGRWRNSARASEHLHRVHFASQVKATFARRAGMLGASRRRVVCLVSPCVRIISIMCKGREATFTGRRAGAEKKALAGASIAADAITSATAEPLTC